MLLKDGLIKVMEGFTTMEELLRVIDVNDDFGEDDELRDAIIGKTKDKEETNDSSNPFLNANNNNVELL